MEELECGDDGVDGRCLEPVADRQVLGSDERSLNDVVERRVERRGERATASRRDITRTHHRQH